MKTRLLIVNAGPACAPIARHLGDESIHVLALAWHPRSSVDVGAAGIHRDEDPRKHKFALAHGAHHLDGKIIKTAPHIEAVALVDDDLVPVGCTWTDVFDLFLETGLDVAQPAIHRSSGNHYSHPITLQEPGARWRRTDFVEVQMPFFTRDAWIESVALFADAGYSGWGLESFWGTRKKCGILDATPVLHTRPVRSSEQHAHLGIDHEAEAEAFRQTHGVTRPLERVLEVIR